MTTFEKCDAIRQRVLWLAGEVMMFPSWDDDYCVDQIRKLPEWSAQEKNAAIHGIRLEELTAVECDALGFGAWPNSDVRLIPVWLFPFLDENVTVTSMLGGQVTGKSVINNDNRGGFLAYGIVPTDKRKEG